MPIILRDYQEKAASEIAECYRRGVKRVLYVAPCRSGKTVTFADISQKAEKKGKRVLIIAHRDFLIDQTSRTLNEFNVEHGLVTAGRSMTAHNIQIAMMLSLVRRLDKIAPPDLIIVDEAHRAMCKTYLQIIGYFPDAYLLGVTATPARTDGKGLSEAFDTIVHGPQVRDLISSGHLCQYRLFQPAVKANLDGIDIVAGDYKKSQLAERMLQSEVTGDAITHYLKHAKEKSFAAFCCGVRHAADVSEKFCAAGVPTATINGEMTIPERTIILNNLRSRKILGITAADLISEGFDLPSLDAVIMLRPTQSMVIHVQQSSRALTPAEGKHECIILDHAGNTIKHGYPDEIRNWTLNGLEKPKKKEIETQAVAIITCGECAKQYRSHLRQCPYCLAERGIQHRFPDEIDGELIEIPLAERLARAQYKEALSYCKTPQDIREMAKVHKKNPLWAVYRVMDMHGVNAWKAAIMLGYNPMITKHMAKKQA